MSDHIPTLSRNILLRDVIEDDLPIFYDQQLDPIANYMAAFTPKDPTDKAAFAAHWAKILADDSTTNRTILLDGQVAGHIASFEQFGELEVSYWLGKEYWGKGLATQALTLFLHHMTIRPVHGRAVRDNIASLRVLEKCGFRLLGYDKAFATGRGTEVEEAILILR